MMYEADLGKVLSGTEKAPEAPADSEETAAASFEKDKLAFQEKNAKLSTRLYVGRPGRVFKYCVSSRLVRRSD